MGGHSAQMEAHPKERSSEHGVESEVTHLVTPRQPGRARNVRQGAQQKKDRRPERGGPPCEDAPDNFAVARVKPRHGPRVGSNRFGPRGPGGPAVGKLTGPPRSVQAKEPGRGPGDSAAKRGGVHAVRIVNDDRKRISRAIATRSTGSPHLFSDLLGQS